MMMYVQLPAVTRAVFGALASGLMLLAAWTLVEVSSARIRRRYMAAACVLMGFAVLILQGCTAVNTLLDDPALFSLSAQLFFHLPVWADAGGMALVIAAEVFLLAVVRKQKKKMLTINAVKESLDTLPDGVCFFDSDGQPLLVNAQMDRISGELFSSEILNGERFWHSLQTDAFPVDAQKLQVHPTITVRTADGRVWDFRRSQLTIDKDLFYEIIAYDVTAQYRLRGELERRNRALGQINERLRQYSRDVEKITRDNEILTAKRKIHDDVGRSLLAFRSYLAHPDREGAQQELLMLWRHTVDVLRNEAASERKTDEWALLLEAAQAVGVQIEVQGVIPPQGKARSVLIAAIHECLTNTVKHADGDHLFVSVFSDACEITAELTNNGKPPAGMIRETGGLLNLRRMAETAGGVMTVMHTPRFLLRITIPEGV